MLSAFSSKASISDGMGCICYGQLHVLEGTLNAERYIKGFRETYAPLQRMCISTGQSKTTYCSYYNNMTS